mgnify:CR=1 FL=1
MGEILSKKMTNFDTEVIHASSGVRILITYIQIINQHSMMRIPNNSLHS